MCVCDEKSVILFSIRVILRMKFSVIFFLCYYSIMTGFQRTIDVLYYTTHSRTEEGVLAGNSNSLAISFENPPEGFSGGISSRRMTDHKFDQYKDNNYYLVYEGFRVPAKSDMRARHLGVSLYKEDLNIQTPAGSLHASCIYPDSGSGDTTTTSFTEFIVNGASGNFSGARKILIEYSNDGSAPWARDGDNKPVRNARRMALIGDGEAVPNAKVQSRNSLRTMLI